MSVECHAAVPPPRLTREVRLVEWLFLAVGPAVAFWMMHFQPVNQRGFLDPYFYTGYINNFTDLFERYGATYYSVRFGTLLPAHLTTALFGPIGGYFVLRHAYALLAGLPFYVLIRQRFGRPAAMAVYVLLITSPFFARTVLWDHPDASGVPFLFAAICLFTIEHRARRTLDLCAGVCAAMALHSNIFVAAPLSIYMAAYAALWVAWRRSPRTIAVRLLMVVAGVAATTAFGVSYYFWRVGYVDIVSVTIQTVFSLTEGRLSNWQVADAAWMSDSFWVFTPVFLAVLAPLAWGRRRVDFTDAVLWAGAAGTTAFYYAYQFLLNGHALDLFYYFSYLLPSVFLLFALTLGAILSSTSTRAAWFGAGVVVLAATGPWILFSFERGVVAQPIPLTHHLLIVLGTLVLLLVRRLVPFGTALTTLVATASLGFLLFSSFSPDQYAKTVNSRINPTHLEADVYRVALQFIEAVPRSAQRPGVMRFWYRDTPGRSAVDSVQSTFLWEYSRLQGRGRGLPDLDQSDVEALQGAGVRWLGLLAEDEAQLALGRAALSRHRVEHVLRDARVLTAGAYTLHYELLELR